MEHIYTSSGKIYAGEIDFFGEFSQTETSPLPQESPIINNTPLNAQGSDSRGVGELAGTPVAPEQGKTTKGLNLGTDILFPKDPARSQEFIKRLGETIPGEMAKGLWNFMQLPGRVAKGENVSIDEMIETSVKFAGDWMGGGLATASLKPGVGLFGGRLSKRAVEVAEKWEERKFSPTTIKEITGLERGKDGEWRREFDDSVADLMPNLKDKSTLGDVLIHQEFYRAYPEAKDIKVVFDRNLGPTATFKIDTNAIHIQPKYKDQPEQLKKILLHETQHWIQEVEGFAKGSNANVLAGDLESALIMEPRLATAIKHFEKLDKKIQEGKASSEDKSDFEFLGTEINRILGLPKYRRTAGEVEAKNVEDRVRMTAKERRSSTAESTERFPRKDQNIITEDNMMEAYGLDVLSKEELEQYLKNTTRGANKEVEGKQASSKPDPYADVYKDVIRIEVYDPQTGKVVGTFNDAKPSTRKRARNKADKLDNEYGGYRYKVRYIRESDKPITE